MGIIESPLFGNIFNSEHISIVEDSPEAGNYRINLNHGGVKIINHIPAVVFGYKNFSFAEMSDFLFADLFAESDLPIVAFRTESDGYCVLKINPKAKGVTVKKGCFYEDRMHNVTINDAQDKNIRFIESTPGVLRGDEKADFFQIKGIWQNKNFSAELVFIPS